MFPFHVSYHGGATFPWVMRSVFCHLLMLLPGFLEMDETDQLMVHFVLGIYHAAYASRPYILFFREMCVYNSVITLSV